MCVHFLLLPILRRHRPRHHPRHRHSHSHRRRHRHCHRHCPIAIETGAQAGHRHFRRFLRQQSIMHVCVC